MLTKLWHVLDSDDLLAVGMLLGGWSGFAVSLYGPELDKWPWWLWAGLLILAVSTGILGWQILWALVKGLRDWKPWVRNGGKRRTPTSPQQAMDTPRPHLDDKTVAS